jgi:hypothetical protein
MHVQATRGAGKSTLLAMLALGDWIRGKPVVLCDVQGGLVEQIIWRLRKVDFGREIRNALLERIEYVDMSGKSGRIYGWPFLYQLPGDSLHAVSQRFIELTKKLDPDLSSAPILGSGALDFIATYAGMALFAMGCQLTEAIDLLTYPERWAGRLRQAAQDHREAEEPVRYFLSEYPKLDEHQRQNQILTFRNKLAPFVLDPTRKAMFGASQPGIDWHEVVRGSKLVILDFQDLRGKPADLRFRMRWSLAQLFEYLAERKEARRQPISVILDELAFLLSQNVGSDDLLAADLDSFINTEMRKRNVWLTVAHQELYQIPDRIKGTLLGMGTQIIGGTSSRKGAEMVAENYFSYDPYWVKKEIPRWAVMSHQRLGMYVNRMGMDSPIMWNDQYIKTVDYLTEEFTLDEQREMTVAEFLNISKFHFLIAHSGQEGSLSRDLRKVSIRRQVGLVGFPDERLVARDREWLMERSGTPIEAIGAEIRQRQDGLKLQSIRGKRQPKRVVELP